MDDMTEHPDDEFYCPACGNTWDSCTCGGSLLTWDELYPVDRPLPIPLSDPQTDQDEEIRR